MLQEPPIRVCLGVVELVHDHNVELSRVQLVDRSVQRLDRREHVIPMDRALSRDEALPEHRIVNHQPEDFLALLEDLVAVSHEQQPFIAGLAQPPVVECRDPCLAGPSGSHHQVAEMPPLSLCVERLEHLHLERFGLDVDAKPVRRRNGPRPVLGVERRLQPIAIDPRVIGLEFRLIPVLLERRPDPVDDRQVVHSGRADVPLEPIQ